MTGSLESFVAFAGAQRCKYKQSSFPCRNPGKFYERRKLCKCIMVQLTRNRPPIILIWGHTQLSFQASTGSFHESGASGGLNRRSPVGGLAKGIELNTLTPSFTFPLTGPYFVSTWTWSSANTCGKAIHTVRPSKRCPVAEGLQLVFWKLF